MRFQDTDCNTALHFGARNGNFKICNFIIEQAASLTTEAQDLHNLVNCRNKRGFTPLLELSFRGYHTENKKDKAKDNRARIITKLLLAGAISDYSREETRMTPMHWLAFNNDREAI